MLYEIDGHEDDRLIAVLDMFRRFETSCIAYKTLNGFHFVGLTPMTAQEWGYYFQRLQNRVPEYFSGQTLRISLKENEKQEMVYLNLRYPYIERLGYMYFRRFNIPESEIVHFGEGMKYTCVFEKYWTGKIR